MAIDLSRFFEKVGLAYKTEMEQAIEKQMAIDGEAFHPVTVSTMKSRQYRENANGRARSAAGLKKLVRERSFSRNVKGKLGSFTKMDARRMYFTRRFWQNAFKFESGPTWARLYVNKSYYTLGQRQLKTYDQILDYNNKGVGDNPNNALLFPQTTVQVANMNASRVAQNIFESPQFKNDILRQVTADFVRNTTVKINLSL